MTSLHPLDQLLSSPTCPSLYSLRQQIFLSLGIPDTPQSLRPQIWRLLLINSHNNASTSRTKEDLEQELKEKRESYYAILEGVMARLVKQNEAEDEMQEEEKDRVEEEKEPDEPAPSSLPHPSSAPPSISSSRRTRPPINVSSHVRLTPSDHSLLSIRKDVSRTSLSLSFFSQPVPIEPESPLCPQAQANGRVVPNRRAVWGRLRKLGVRDGEGEAWRGRKGMGRKGTLKPKPKVRREDTMKVGKGLGRRSVEGGDDQGLNGVENAEKRTSTGNVNFRDSISSAVSSSFSYNSPSESFTTNSEVDKADEEAEEEEDEAELQDLRWEVMERILYVYSVVNPGVGYVQGMNEILSPLYYILSHDPSPTSAPHTEADVFWSFSTLLSSILDLFLTSLDGDVEGSSSPWSEVHRGSTGKGKEKSGIGYTLKRLQGELRWLDEEVEGTLREKGVRMAYFAVRWLTTMLAGEWRLPELVRVWDCIISLAPDSSTSSSAVTEKQSSLSPPLEFLIDVCCAMVLREKQRLLEANFAVCMGVLQRPSNDGVEEVLQRALRIREKRLAAAMLGQGPPEDSDDEFEAADKIAPDINSSNQFWKNRLNFASKRIADVTNSYVSKVRNSRSQSLMGADGDDRESVISEASIATAPPMISLPSHGRNNSSVDLKNSGDAFKKYMGTTWTTIQNSDTAANLSKAATNWSVTASIWKDSAPGVLEKFKNDAMKLGADISARAPAVLEQVQNEGSRLVGSVASPLGSGKDLPRRPDSPEDPPFDIPEVHDGISPILSRSGENQVLFASPSGLRNGLLDSPKPIKQLNQTPSTPLNVRSFEDGKNVGNGPKPLILGSGTGSISSNHGGNNRRSTGYSSGDSDGGSVVSIGGTRSRRRAAPPGLSPIPQSAQNNLSFFQEPLNHGHTYGTVISPISPMANAGRSSARSSLSGLGYGTPPTSASIGNSRPASLGVPYGYSVNSHARSASAVLPSSNTASMMQNIRGLERLSIPYGGSTTEFGAIPMDGSKSAGAYANSFGSGSLGLKKVYQFEEDEEDGPRTPSAVKAKDGRGWTLVDNPVRSPAVTNNGGGSWGPSSSMTSWTNPDFIQHTGKEYDESSASEGGWTSRPDSWSQSQVPQLSSTRPQLVPAQTMPPVTISTTFEEYLANRAPEKSEKKREGSISSSHSRTPSRAGSAKSGRSHKKNFSTAESSPTVNEFPTTTLKSGSGHSKKESLPKLRTSDLIVEEPRSQSPTMLVKPKRKVLQTKRTLASPMFSPAPITAIGIEREDGSASSAFTATKGSSLLVKPKRKLVKPRSSGSGVGDSVVNGGSEE